MPSQEPQSQFGAETPAAVITERPQSEIGRNLRPSVRFLLDRIHARLDALEATATEALEVLQDLRPSRPDVTAAAQRALEELAEEFIIDSTLSKGGRQ